MSAHHYTNSTLATAQVSVNAGTCLEDANEEDNVFASIGQAVSEVCVCVNIIMYVESFVNPVFCPQWSMVVTLATTGWQITTTFACALW